MDLRQGLEALKLGSAQTASVSPKWIYSVRIVWYLENVHVAV
jgi:hypothetical protein